MAELNIKGKVTFYNLHVEARYVFCIVIGR